MTETDILTWVGRDGLAIVLLVYVIVRLDARLTEVMLKLTQLVDLLAGRAKVD